MKLGEQGGKELVLADLNPCYFVGEVAQISYEKLKSMFTVFPDLSFAILSQLANWLRKMNHKIGDVALMDVSGRVARSLLALWKEPDAVTHPDGMRIHITRQELGSIVGCSR